MKNIRMQEQKIYKTGSRIRQNCIILAVMLLIVVPVINIAIWSFTARWPWPALFPERFSSRGIGEILRRGKETGKLLFSSVAISLVVGVLSVICGCLTARAIVFYDFFGKRLVNVLVMLPFFVPATVFVMGVQILFIRMKLAGTVGGVVLVHLICSLPYAVRLISDGMRAGGLSLEEQARVLGASEAEAFFRVGLPTLTPVLLSSLGMSYIVSFSQYFLTLLIGGGKVKTFTIVMVPYLQNGSRDIACIYSIIFTGISVLIFAVFEWIAARWNRSNSTEFYG